MSAGGTPQQLRARRPSTAARTHLRDARFHLHNAERALARAAEAAEHPRELDFAQKAMSYARRLRRAMPRHEPAGCR